MTTRIEVIKNLSLCCNAPIHIEHKENGTWKSERPFCSKCYGFPPISVSVAKKILKELNQKECD